MLYTIKETIYAITHWKTITETASLLPSSRLMAAMAATQGVYSRQNTSSERTEGTESIEAIDVPSPKSTVSVETTLSFAMKPLTRDVVIRQSSRPIGAKTGDIIDAIIPSILSEGSVTIRNPKEKLCKNHITIVAQKITVKALCRKSRAFSHNSMNVVRAVGRR